MMYALRWGRVSHPQSYRQIREATRDEMQKVALNYGPAGPVYERIGNI